MNSINFDKAVQVSMKLLPMSMGADDLSAIFSFPFSANLIWTLLNENLCFPSTDLQRADPLLGSHAIINHWPFVLPPFSLFVVGIEMLPEHLGYLQVSLRGIKGNCRVYAL